MPDIDRYLRTLVESGASDLHVSPESPAMLRVDGELRPLEDEVLSAAEVERLLREMMTPDKQKEFDETSDIDFGYLIDGIAGFRGNVFRDRLGVGGVFRAIPAEVPSFDDLDLPEAIRNFAKLHKGLVLVTGPTGSGKSTTLAAIIDEINRTRGAHIITLEDPIEFVHPNKKSLVNQRQVGLHTKSFARALRAALREDPDVILIGEMRDLETTAMALEAAETGHLVFSTLHTCSAASTVDRIIDQFPAGDQAQVRTMLSAVLQGVVAQTLLRRKDKGRVAALEILLGTSALSAQIREGKTHQITSVIQTGGRLGMCLLNDSIVKLAGRGLIDPEEGYNKAVDKDELLRGYEAAGIPFVPGLSRRKSDRSTVNA